jgi:hypothetical protein
MGLGQRMLAGALVALSTSAHARSAVGPVKATFFPDM